MRLGVSKKKEKGGKRTRGEFVLRHLLAVGAVAGIFNELSLKRIRGRRGLLALPCLVRSSFYQPTKTSHSQCNTKKPAKFCQSLQHEKTFTYLDT
jgi:hypothetical protein